MTQKKEKILFIICSVCLFISSCIGLFYCKSSTPVDIVNSYGDTVTLYGHGIYAHNSFLSVANRMGADVTGLILGVVLLVCAFFAKDTPKWLLFKVTHMITVIYYFLCLAFGTAINQLYYIYMLGLGSTFFLLFSLILKFHQCHIFDLDKVKKVPKGVSSFLIIAGLFTAGMWCSEVFKSIQAGNFTSVAEIGTTDVTYVLDVAIYVPVFILAGIWLRKNNELGYKYAMPSLYILVYVGVMVILQFVFMMQLGIEVPIYGMIGMIISFIILGIISAVCMMRLLKYVKAE